MRTGSIADMPFTHKSMSERVSQIFINRLFSQSTGCIFKCIGKQGKRERKIIDFEIEIFAEIEKWKWESQSSMVYIIRKIDEIHMQKKNTQNNNDNFSDIVGYVCKT